MKYDAPERWLLLVGLGTLVPVAMFHFIEQPMIDVGRKVASMAVATRLNYRDGMPEPAASPASRMVC